MTPITITQRYQCGRNLVLGLHFTLSISLVFQFLMCLIPSFAQRCICLGVNGLLGP